MRRPSVFPADIGWRVWKPHEKTLRCFQLEHALWSHRNFPGSRKNPMHGFMGMVEELGELSHALLKSAQGIRGSKAEHEAAAKDAVGDILIYMMDFCTKKGWSLQDILTETWAEVGQRDWTKHKKTGKKVGRKTPAKRAKRQYPRTSICR